MHPLIPLTQFGSMPAPMSSTTPGEAWVWGDYVLTLQTHPKIVLDLVNEMSGRPAEDSLDLDYPFVVTVYYRKDRNPHGPSSQPILVVGLERVDYAKAMAKMGFDGDLPSDIPPGMGPPGLGVFTATSHLNMGRYGGDLGIDSVRQRLFAVVTDHIHPNGEPVRIGPIAAIFGHPDTGWPAQKKKSGCMPVVLMVVLLAACCGWCASGNKAQEPRTALRPHTTSPLGNAF